jgi:hypothetical protein
VFKKKKLNLEEMTAEEMQALHSRMMKRILWVNGLWLVFVVFMLFWKTGIGIFLLVITAVKYFFDYHDVESQAHNANFVSETIKKELTGKMEDD